MPRALTYLLDANIKSLTKYVRRIVLGSKAVRGPVSQSIVDRLNRFAFYRDFTNGVSSREQFYRELLRHENELGALGLPARVVRYASRLPPDERDCVRSILEDLCRRGLIPTSQYDLGQFDAYRSKVRSEFDHGEDSTWIFSEEARLVFALSQICKPRRLVVLGSYYSYWAIWALPALADNGGRAVLIDINPQACALARRNVRRMGFASCATVEVADAIGYLQRCHDSYDLALLDAEGATNAPNLLHRGKSIYYPIIKRLVRRLDPGGLVVCHDIMLNSLVTDPVVDQYIARHREALHEFLPFVRGHFGSRAEYETTQGIGVYRA